MKAAFIQMKAALNFTSSQEAYLHKLILQKILSRFSWEENKHCPNSFSFILSIFKFVHYAKTTQPRHRVWQALYGRCKLVLSSIRYLEKWLIMIDGSDWLIFDTKNLFY